MAMNKYYCILDKILATGKTQTNKKGNIQYLLNEQLSLTPADLLDIFEGRFSCYEFTPNLTIN